jgi:regulatory protein
MTPQTKLNKSQIVLRQRALDYLAKREYSVVELSHKLASIAKQHELDATQIPEIIEDFKKRNWLSDIRFTEQIVHARKSKFGSARVAKELREKGVSDELIAEALISIRGNELENAKQVWRKKYDHPPRSREEWAKQARFLQSRGFGFEIIKRVINEQEDEA